LLVLAGCAPPLDLPSVAVVAAGRAEAVTEVEIALAPASEGAALRVYRGTVYGPDADGAWRLSLPLVGVGTYAVTAEARDGEERVLQTAATTGEVKPGHQEIVLALSAVDCGVPECGSLDGGCVRGVCDEVAGRCVGEPAAEGSECDDGDPCTAGDRCVAGRCEADPLDEDGDGIPPPQCAVSPGLADCDDADYTVAPGTREVCDGRDNDCDGHVDDGLGLGSCYSGPPETDGVGACARGFRGCDPTTGVVRCLQQTLPRAERLRDGADNDCDGDVDEPDLGCIGCVDGGASVSADDLPVGDHDVIVGLMVEGGVGPEEERASAVLAAQTAVIDRVEALAAGDVFFQPTWQYRTLFAFVAQANLEGLGLLMDDEGVSGLVKDFPVSHALAESVPLVSADRARQAAGTAGEGVAVAVVDTGVDYTHPAFGGCDAPGQGAGCRVVAGYDFVELDDDPMDPSGQGTLVAGVVAGAATDGCPGGVAPGASVVALRALDATGEGRFSALLGALDWVYEHREEHGIRVVNISAASGRTFDNPSLCDFDVLANAIARLGTVGVLTVAAAGNHGDGEGLAFPACASGALSVGAVYDSDRPGRVTHCLVAGEAGECAESCDDLQPPAGEVACFSNGGEHLDLVAPGDEVVGPAPGGGCTPGVGTSVAAPHVAGAAALLLAEHPEWTRDELVEHLRLGGTPVTDRRTGLEVPRLDVLRAREPLTCTDVDGDGEPDGLRCPREEAACEGDGGPCPTGQPGACAAGTSQCDGNGGLRCLPNVVPRPETCNGLDDDCDGDVDEDPVDHGAPCDTGEPGVCGRGTGDCDADGVLHCLADVAASEEVCNDEDDDCDGETDEDPDAWGCWDYYPDGDGDGWGSGDALCLCGPRGEHVTTEVWDCNDDDPLVFPGAQPDCVGGCADGWLDEGEACDDANGVADDACNGCLGERTWNVASITPDVATFVEGCVLWEGDVYLGYGDDLGEYGDNLLRNPGAEDGTDHWVGGELGTAEVGRTGAAFSDREGSFGPEQWSAFQLVELAPWARHVSSGAAWVQAEDWVLAQQQATARWWVDFCGLAGCEGLGGYDSGELADKSWERLRWSVAVPPEAMQVRVRIGGSVFFFAAVRHDDLAVRLRIKDHAPTCHLVLEHAFEHPPVYGELTWTDDGVQTVGCRAQTSASGAMWEGWEAVPATRSGAPLSGSPSVRDGHEHVRVRCDLQTSRSLQTPVLRGLALRTWDG